jgi:hypothetical protein
MSFSTGFINHPRVTPDVVVHNLTVARHYTPTNSLYDFSHREQDYFGAYDCFIPFSLGSTSSQTRLAPPSACGDPLEPPGPLPNAASSSGSSPMGLARLPGRLMAIYAAQQVRHARNRAPAFSREWRGPTEPKESRRLLIVT